MNTDERIPKENAARLIKAACAAPARPGEQQRERVYRVLLDHLRARSAVVAFSDLAVALLAGVLVALALWLAARVLADGALALDHPSLLVALVWCGLNLATVPAAAGVILRRRKHG
jgi:hypothetical protein